MFYGQTTGGSLTWAIRFAFFIAIREPILSPNVLPEAHLSSNEESCLSLMCPGRDVWTKPNSP